MFARSIWRRRLEMRWYRNLTFFSTIATSLSHPCGNKLMKEDVLYDGIKKLYTFLVEESSSIVNVLREEKKDIFA